MEKQMEDSIVVRPQEIEEHHTPTKKLVSVVIPCYNEEQNINAYPEKLIKIMDNSGLDYEIIAVDDGSTKDKTWEALETLANKYPQFTALKHSRNYGMGAAYQTAFDESKGDYVVTYSADLEISADAIIKVVQKLEEGYDMVNTHRVGRWSEEGGVMRKLPSEIANNLIKSISGVSVQDTGSGVKGFRRFIIDNLRVYGEMHRFLPAYASLFSKRITEFEVEYHERTYGESAYGSIKRTFYVFVDLLTLKFMLTFATKPFHMMPGRIFGFTGLVSFGLGILITVYLLFTKLLGNDIGDRPLFIGGLVLVLFGVMLVMTGLLGELLLRIYFESSGRKAYIVSERA